MIQFVQNGHTNHANLKVPPNPHSESTAPGMVSPGPYNSKYLDPSEPIFQSYTGIYGPLLNDRSPLSASMEIMILEYVDNDCCIYLRIIGRYLKN